MPDDHAQAHWDRSPDRDGWRARSRAWWTVHEPGSIQLRLHGRGLRQPHRFTGAGPEYRAGRLERLRTLDRWMLAGVVEPTPEMDHHLRAPLPAHMSRTARAGS